MYYFVISFLLGVSSLLFFRAIPPFILIILLLMVSACLFFYFRNNVTKIIFAAMLGFFWVMFFALIQTNSILPKKLENKKVSITGVVSSIPVNYKDHVSFIFNTKQINGVSRKKKIKLSWYDSHIHLLPGEVRRLIVRLKRPHGLMNPGGFDYEAWLFQNRIDAIGYVVYNAPPHSINLQFSWQLINRLRYKILKNINSYFSKQPLVGFLTALSIGFRKNITQQQWAVLKLTGTNHLIAIAGLHIGILAGFIYFLFDFLWRRFADLPLKIASPKVAILASLLVACFYGLLAGFSIQTQRALIMLAVFSIAILVSRKMSVWQGYIFALFIVLVFNPFSIISPGFWLSFIIVAAILYRFSGFRSRQNFFWKMVNMQWVIMLSVLPLSLWYFHEVSWVSCFANIIAVPWFSFIIIPCCFLGVIVLMINHCLGCYLLGFVLKNLEFFWDFLHWIVQLPHLNVQYYLSNEWTFLFLVLSVFLLLSPRGFSGKYLSLFLVLPCFFPKQPILSFGAFKFTLLDVGQGLASVIRTQHHVLLFDTGPRYGVTSDAGERVILPYLASQSIHQVNMLVVSHGDSDHIGGARSVIKKIKVNAILSSVPNYFQRFKYSNVKACHQGQHWVWDGVEFTMLSPVFGQPYLGNNSSCVLHVKSLNQSLLLTGDIEKLTESHLDKTFPQQLSAEILVAPHHGSDSSSSQAFIQAVHPHYVLYPVGYLNRFHFPSQVVMARYRHQGSIQLNTAALGAIDFLTGSRLSYDAYRLKNKHIWMR